MNENDNPGNTMKRKLVLISDKIDCKVKALKGRKSITT